MRKITHRQISLQKAAATTSSVLVFAGFENISWNTHPFFKFILPADKEYLLHVEKDTKKDVGILEKVILPLGKRKVLLFGLGANEKWSFRSFERAVRCLAHLAKKYKIGSFTVHLDDFKVPGIDREKIAEGFAANIELADYEFVTHREPPKEGWPALKNIFYVCGANKNVAAQLSTGSLIGREVNYARELANTPGGLMTPTHVANAARATGKEAGFSVRVLSEKEMKKLGMGGVLGVSAGSTEEAQFVIMEYWGKKSKKDPFVFIGKGITFDSGGLQIKPSQSMEEMHMDMSGGAAVIAALSVIARMKLPINCVGIIPAVENMPSGGSYRPGDLLKTMSSKTIEIGHTDAEGRVVLSDALTYAERYTPKLVVDVATLTGACTVALGHYLSALLTPQDHVAKFMRACGDASGDYVWQLPLWEEYESHVKGYSGDVMNTGRYREAGTIQGAIFLHQFAKNFPAWAHIDIASTMTGKEDQWLARGASGAGTRLLIEVARRYKEFF
ncbi:leucyl aminopeptidase [Candidatus Uhrbacteria bacterium]|nr:leucyl aminopeptidase [Candidatus Uhrbacteria bacterium]